MSRWIWVVAGVAVGTSLPLAMAVAVGWLNR